MNLTVFTYAAARVRAMEPKLLDPTDVERMLGAKNATEAYKILNDFDYSTHIGDIDKVTQFQEVITSGLVDAKTVLESICPDPKILDILFLCYDFHNIKAILKGKLAKKGQEEIRTQLLPLGRVSIEDMIKFFYDKNHGILPLPEKYATTIKDWIEVTKKTVETHDNDPRIIDLVLDQAQFAVIVDIAMQTQNEFVIKFVKQTIDLHNIKTYARIKLLRQVTYFSEGNKLPLAFVRGGYLQTYKFTETMDVDNGQLANVFRGTDYFELVQKGIGSYEKFKAFAFLEKYADEYLLNLARSARFITFGPEALVAYYFAKQNNASIIRMIMVGKLTDLPDDMLRERLNQLYV